MIISIECNCGEKLEIKSSRISPIGDLIIEVEPCKNVPEHDNFWDDSEMVDKVKDMIAEG